MKLTATIIRQAIDNNDCVINARVRSYSGRGMSGRECLGVTIESLGDLVRLGAAIAYEVGVAAQDDPEWDEWTEAVDELIGEDITPALDSMGHDYIAYWPSIPFADEDDTDGAVAGSYTSHGDGFGA